MVPTGNKIRRSPRRHQEGPSRGDERRSELLRAFDELLRTRPLAEIAVGEITQKAGVGRSTFYFYFPTKPAAVSALLSDFYEDMRAVGAAWLTGADRDPLPRLDATLRAAAGLWRERAPLLAAMLDAIGTDPDVRRAWDDWIEDFVTLVAGVIQLDLDRGLTHPDLDPSPLAAILMGAALNAMERDVRALTTGHPAPDALTHALIQIWRRAIYPPSTR